MLDAIAKGKGKEVIEATKKYTVLPQQLKAIDEELKKLSMPDKTLFKNNFPFAVAISNSTPVVASV